MCIRDRIRDLNDFTRIRESDLEINLNPEKFQPILELVKPVLEMDFKKKVYLGGKMLGKIYPESWLILKGFNKFSSI